MLNIYDFVDKSIVLENELMSAHTSFRTGGPARYLIMPENTLDIINALRYGKNAGIEIFTMGCGSNLLVSDKGFDGMIIKICEKFSNCFVVSEDERTITVRAQAGCRLSKLANFVAKLSCTGMEALSGIPGSVGGAVRMNAGAYDGQIADVLVSSDYIDIATMEVKTKTASEHNFRYRYSSYNGEANIIVSADFKVTKTDNTQAVYDKMRELNKRRADKQPLEYPSAGSTFKRPEGHYAGALIEENGLKGYRVGGACVSTKHAGFIINIENATSDDIMNVIHHVMQTVYNNNKVALTPEIVFLGKFSFVTLINNLQLNVDN